MLPSSCPSVLSLDIERELVPIYSPPFANKDQDYVKSPEVLDFYLIWNGADDHFLIFAPKLQITDFGSGLKSQESGAVAGEEYHRNMELVR